MRDARNLLFTSKVDAIQEPTTTAFEAVHGDVVVPFVLEVRDIDCDCWLSNYGVLHGSRGMWGRRRRE